MDSDTLISPKTILSITLTQHNTRLRPFPCILSSLYPSLTCFITFLSYTLENTDALIAREAIPSIQAHDRQLASFSVWLSPHTSLIASSPFLGLVPHFPLPDTRKGNKVLYLPTKTFRPTLTQQRPRLSGPQTPLCNAWTQTQTYARLFSFPPTRTLPNEHQSNSKARVYLCSASV